MEWISRRFRLRTGLVAAVCLGLFPVATFAANAPSAKLALSFRPVQKDDVEYETPTEAEYAKCKVEVERRGKASGWIVYGPNGQVLRRFVDTNGDNVVDQWRYYQHGLEVYRDVDTNFNNKVDQSRWLNTGGSRWGIDSDEDGRIDSWKVLSAEEASREAVRALTMGDVQMLSRLLITGDEIKSLGIEGEYRKKILDSVDSPATKLRAVLAAKTDLSPKSRWVRFNATSPGLIPADDGKASTDLYVYENAMAIVETDGKSSLVQIGEMIQVGKVWKLTQVPQPVGENMRVIAGGLLMQPEFASANAGTTAKTAGISPKMQKLLEQLQELDRNAPKPTDTATAFATYNSRRVDLIDQLVTASTTDEDREQWRRQLIDGVAAAVQTGNYPQGLKRLQSLEAELRRENAKSDLVPYASFRRLLAEYTNKLQATSAEKRSDVQKWWQQELEKFATAYPKSDDAPEAMLQLAVMLEFGGNLKDARKWYTTAVETNAKSTAGERATGALRRLDLVGRPLELSGPSLAGGTISTGDYRSKVLLVIFWSTWCKPCTEDLPQLQAIYKKYRGDGFEILGVNLDASIQPVKPYITQHGVPWPHIHRDGGLDSPPARQFGIISLPTMFLVDRTGKVISRTANVDSLQKELPGLLKAR